MQGKIMATNITAIIYSYKNKNLLKVVRNLIDTTRSDISIYVYDQHQLDREQLFAFEEVEYNHVFWDYQDTPIQYKSEIISGSKSPYFLILSDDCMLKDGWDQETIGFLQNKKAVVSGHGAIKVLHKDRYFLGKESLDSQDFSISHFVDRNFIFGTREYMNSFPYPDHLKYYGEEEHFSISFWRAAVDVYSGPSDLYEDLNQRTIENRYVPYSREHNYDKAISLMGETMDENRFYRTAASWLQYHNLDINKIKPLPYQNNDVPYNPNRLMFQDIDARKFISNTKAVY